MAMATLENNLRQLERKHLQWSSRIAMLLLEKLSTPFY